MTPKNLFYQLHQWSYNTIRILFRFYLNKRYKINLTQKNVLYATPPPYIILTHYASYWDPFLLSVTINKTIHFIIPNTYFKQPITRKIFALLGVMSYTKNLTDAHTMSHIMYLHKKKAIIGIFPEGQASWDGRTTTPIHSTAKLIKMLHIPVLHAHMQGSFLSHGRWCHGHRKGNINTAISYFLSPSLIKRMSTTNIYSKLCTIMEYDQLENQKTKKIPYYGKSPAQYLERSLFVCPSCYHINTLKSTYSLLSCLTCGYKVRYNQYGLFDKISHNSVRFTTMGEWNQWQQRFLSAYLCKGTPQHIFFSDKHCVLQCISNHSTRIKKKGAFSINRRYLSFTTTKKEYRFPIRKIQIVHIQEDGYLMFLHNKAKYIIKIRSPRGCIYKYILAVSFLQKTTQNVCQTTSYSKRKKKKMP